MSNNNKRVFFPANRVMMDPLEVELINESLDLDKIMLEWGSGNSTLYFSNFVSELHTVEHSREWYELTSRRIKRCNINNVIYNYVPSDVQNIPKQNKKEPGYEGMPPEYFRTYIDTIEKYDKSTFAAILVDGRCRLYCAIKALPYLKEGGCLYIHDFFHRKYYHKVFGFYNIVDAVPSTTQTIVKLEKLPRQEMPDPSFYDDIKTVDEIIEILPSISPNFEITEFLPLSISNNLE